MMIPIVHFQSRGEASTEVFTNIFQGKMVRYGVVDHDIYSPHRPAGQIHWGCVSTDRKAQHSELD